MQTLKLLKYINSLVNICIWPLQPRAGVTGHGPGKDQLEQRQTVHGLGHAVHQPFSHKSAWKNLESGMLKGKGKRQFGRVTGNKSHACN